MPYPGFHSCRLRDPSEFEKGSFRTIKRDTQAGRVQMIIGKLKGKSTTTAQAIRYPIDQFTEGEARKLCEKAGGKSFEPAKKTEHTAPIYPEILIDEDMTDQFADGHELLEFAFVEKTEKGHWAVKRKEAKEYPEDTLVLEVFDDEKLAKDYRDEMNRRKFPAGHDRNPEPVIGIGYAKGELKTETLTAVPIFAPGTWTSMEGRTRIYTEKDVAEMVRVSNELITHVKPFLKLMHLNAKDHKKVTAMPALGWLENFRRKGKQVICDIKNVPIKIAKLIRAGNYRRISPEIFPTFKDEATGKTYKNVIGAGGLLGAVHPAITTIDDVLKLYGAADESQLAAYIESFTLAEDAHAEVEALFMGVEYSEYHEGGDSEMTPEEIQAAIKKAVEEAIKPIEEKATAFQSGVRKALGIDEKADPVETIKSLKTGKEESDKALAEKEKADFKAGIDKLIHEAKEGGKLLPAQEPSVRMMIEGWRQVAAAADDGKVAFTAADGTEKRVDVVEHLKLFFEGQPTVMQYGERAPEGGPAAAANIPADVAMYAETDGISIDPESLKLHNQAMALMQQNEKLTYEQATTQITGMLPVEEKIPRGMVKPERR